MPETAEVVIWSADVDESTLDGLVLAGMPVKLIKLDRLGLTRMGLMKIASVQDLGYQVFADAKIVEIPDKSLELAREHLRYRPWMLNCMAGICSTGEMTHEDPKKVDGLKRFADACHEVGTKPCAVTVLTSKTERLARREFGTQVIDQVVFYAGLLVDAGFTDMVCSPREAKHIRDYPEFDRLQLNTPGIRLPGSSADDQARVDTPRAALEAGVDRLVIGRDLTNGDLAENFKRIDANLNPEKEPMQ
jgi:orotidine-5'-phosphate decarboxylase